MATTYFANGSRNIKNGPGEFVVGRERFESYTQWRYPLQTPFFLQFVHPSLMLKLFESLTSRFIFHLAMELQKFYQLFPWEFSCKDFWQINWMKRFHTFHFCPCSRPFVMYYDRNSQAFCNCNGFKLSSVRSFSPFPVVGC